MGVRVNMTTKPVPSDPDLYGKVKKEADAKFLAQTSIYKSAWIVREYKKRGGKYDQPKPKMNKNDSGLPRWFKEEWVDTNRPIRQNGKVVGYEPCGRSKASTNGTYPLCRPLHRITPQTPLTVNEIPKSALKKANQEKQKLKNNGSIPTIYKP